MKKILFTFLISVIALVYVRAQSENSLLYKVESPSGKISYLFGTYHLINSGFVESRDRIYQAFQNADQVVVETVIDSSKLMQFSMKMMMQEQSLPDLLDTSEYNMVSEEFERVVGMNLGLFNTMKPMAVNTTYIAALYMNNLPEAAKFEGKPMDLYFASKGKQNGAEVIALESMMEQADLLFGSQTIEEQAEDLVELMEDKEEALKMSRSLTEAYLSENLPQLSEISRESEQNYGDMTVLLDERNQNWMGTLKKVTDEGNAFIAVGALHLTGDNGLISLLEKAGYKVSAVMP